MWRKIKDKFDNQRGKIAVARVMIENGLGIGAGGKIFCGPLSVGDSSVAKASGVDRRTVRATVDSIRNDKSLYAIFSNIEPAGAMLGKVAHHLGFGVVELEASAATVGIVASASGLLAKSKISIRQIYAKDPDLFENPTLTIITARKIPGRLVEEFRNIRGVRRVLLS